MKKFNWKNSKGISVIFLVIAMLLMVTIGYVFSYLIPSKQKSVRPQIYSPQAFLIAQSGVEFAIRYAADQGWRGATDGGTYDLTRLTGLSRTLGNGSFTISYNQASNTLTSTGQITGSSENRVVSLSNFLPFLRLVFVTPDPCYNPPAGDIPAGSGLTRSRTARFYIRNLSGNSVTLTAFSATWTHLNGGNSTLQEIYMNPGTGWVHNYNGPPNYTSGTLPPFSFGTNQTIAPGQTITVLIYMSSQFGGGTPIDYMAITFYTAAGNSFMFNLDANRAGLPAC